MHAYLVLLTQPFSRASNLKESHIGAEKKKREMGGLVVTGTTCRDVEERGVHEKGADPHNVAAEVF